MDPAILVAALIVDTITASYLLTSGHGGLQVRQWYKTLRIGAYSMDVLSLVIGTSLALKIAPGSSIWTQILAVVMVQMAHDVLFGGFVNSAHAKGPLMALFRRYASEMGVKILIADAIMMVATLLLARQLSGRNDLWFLGLVAAYVGLLVVYSF